MAEIGMLAAQAGGNFLSTFGSGLFQYFMQNKQFDQQKELLTMQNQNSIALAQMGFDNQQLMQDKYQNWYSSYMTGLTQQKFENQKDLLTYQNELKAMNTPSALMASHASTNNSITTSMPIPVTMQSHWVNNGVSNSSAQVDRNITSNTAGTSMADDATSGGHEMGISDSLRTSQNDEVENDFTRFAEGRKRNPPTSVGAKNNQIESQSLPNLGFDNSEKLDLTEASATNNAAAADDKESDA